MKNFDQPTEAKDSQSESQKVELLKGRIHYIKSILQFSSPDQLDITHELDGIRTGMEDIKSIAEEAADSISPETKNFLIKLEGLLEYFVFLGKKNPILKKSIKRNLLNAGVSYERDSLAELQSYISRLIKNTEIV